METANKSKSSQRPPIITFICLFFGLFGGLIIVSLIFLIFIMPELREIVIQEYNITTKLIIFMIQFTLSSAGFIGYWKMRKWGVYLYFAMFIVSALRELILSGQINPLGIIPLGIVGVGFAYFNRMK